VPPAATAAWPAASRSTGAPGPLPELTVLA
jgi:hypothetical protein